MVEISLVAIIVSILLQNTIMYKKIKIHTLVFISDHYLIVPNDTNPNIILTKEENELSKE